MLNSVIISTDLLKIDKSFRLVLSIQKNIYLHSSDSQKRLKFKKKAKNTKINKKHTKNSIMLHQL